METLGREESPIVSIPSFMQTWGSFTDGKHGYVLESENCLTTFGNGQQRGCEGLVKASRQSVPTQLKVPPRGVFIRQSTLLLWCSVFTDGEWEGWRCRGNQTGWRLQGPWKGNMRILKENIYIYTKIMKNNNMLFCLTESQMMKLSNTGHMHTCIICCLPLTCSTREQTLPAKLWWKSSIKHPSTSSPTLQQELSSPCSTRCPKCVDKSTILATPSLRASWGSAWQSMDGTWARRPTLVWTLEAFWGWGTDGKRDEHYGICLFMRVHKSTYCRTRDYQYRASHCLTLLNAGIVHVCVLQVGL